MGFPTLTPAFTVAVEIDAPADIGNLSSGGSKIYVPIPRGTIKTEEGYPTQVSASVVTAGDWIHSDPDGKHKRLEVHAVLKTDDGAYINWKYDGLIKMNPAIAKVLTAASDMKTTGFGNVFSQHKFQTGSEKYKFLEDNVWVGAGQFVVSEKGVVVEYKVSQVEA